MSMRNLLFGVAIFIGFTSASFGQEAHFSQYYQNPIMLNPALTGLNECIMRIGGIYRDQWRSVSKPYRTYSFFADARLQPYEFKHDAFGVGLLFVGDKAGSANLSSNDFRATFAYHKGLIKDNQLIISMGLSLGFVNHSLNESKFSFGNQWTGTGFNSYLPDNEPYRKTSATYFDMNAGLLMSYYISDFTILSLGGSINHITNPRYSFFDGDNRVGIKTTLHAGLNTFITDHTMIMPKVYFSMQEKTYDLVLGFNAAYYPRLDPIYMGLWYRWNSDIIPVVGYQFRGFTMMASYDVNISRLSQASNYQGGFEISLVKNFLCLDPFFKPKGKYTKDGKNRCPIF
jgi:type IX secretion system PorP/SprF family membrane protein